MIYGKLLGLLHIAQPQLMFVKYKLGTPKRLWVRLVVRRSVRPQFLHLYLVLNEPFLTISFDKQLGQVMTNSSLKFTDEIGLSYHPYWIITAFRWC